MKNLSQFINLSIAEQLQEIESMRIPSPNPKLRETVRELHKAAESVQADKEAAIFLDGFVQGAVIGLQEGKDGTEN